MEHPSARHPDSSIRRVAACRTVRAESSETANGTASRGYRSLTVPVPRWQWLLIGTGLALVVYALFVVGLVAAGRRADARAVARLIPDCVILLHALLRDPRVPRRSKVLLGCLLAYLAMPFDVVPDLIPVAGQLDDAIIVVFVIRYVLRASGPQLVREHWRGPQRSLEVILRLAYGRAASTDQGRWAGGEGGSDPDRGA